MLELINCNRWRDLCDHIYDYPDFNLPKGNCVVFCPMDHIARFFKEISVLSRSSNKYIVISTCSDYGIYYQAQNPVWLDMKKWLDFVPIDDSLVYNPLILPSRHNPGNCKITDKYSVKMHTFTGATFDSIPENVIKWYCTNCNIEQDNVVPIPFGIPDWSEELITICRKQDRHTLTNRKHGFYLNFQNNTSERVSLKRQFNGLENYTTIMGEISHEDYIFNLLSSVYVVSPTGNGDDCYRTLESVYCGAIPIITDGLWSRAYTHIPNIKVSSYSALPHIYKERGFQLYNQEIENTPADFSYWRNKIENDKYNL